ncbi:MAG: LptF/LptG family permease [Bauldia sp.]
MKTLERYIARRTFAALVMTLLTLSATVWIAQSLRQFDLVTARGQTLVTFFRFSALFFPLLLIVIAPVASFIAIVYVLNTLNSDSELAIVNAGGASPIVLLKPVTLIAVLIAAAVALNTLYLSPLTQRNARNMLAAINSDIITSIIREGQFVRVADGVVLQIKRRNPDRTLSGIFVSDSREQNQVLTYLAESGAVIDAPLGTFLVMANGVIQRQTLPEGAISIIEFGSYAFDLGTFAARAQTPVYLPSERPTEYLFEPDPADPIYQRSPERFATELNDRLSSPLYALSNAIVPLAFLGQARTTRRGRGAAIAGATVVGSAIRGVGFLLLVPASTSKVAAFFLYATPPLAILASLLVTFGLVQPRLPRRVGDFLDHVGAAIAGRFRRSAAAAPGQGAG